MPDALTLARDLRQRDDAKLVELLNARGVVADARVDDFFDLAELLLTPRSIRHALERIDRATLALLVIASEAPAQLSELREQFERRAPELYARVDSIDERIELAEERCLLRSTDAGWFTFASVADVIAGDENADRGLPAPDRLLTEPPPVVADAGGPTPADPDLVASETAWAASVAVAELLLEVRNRQLVELGRGGLSAPDVKRLSQVMRVDGDAVNAHLELAVTAGLLLNGSGRWTLGPDAVAWLRSSVAERWETLAAAWLRGLRSEIRTAFSFAPGADWGRDLVRLAEWLFPAGTNWIGDAVERVEAQASVLGVVTGGRLNSAGAALLAHGVSAGRALIEPYFPAEVEQVYLQHDLTVISPGPLAPERDLRLRTMAHLESRAQASTYRFTPHSVEGALTSGETPESIREFLSALSLTGIPQPVDYLITQAASRFGRIRVGSLDEADPARSESGSRSYVRSDDAALIGQLAVDQALTSLALHRTGEHRLVSRFDAQVVYWSLRDAHYPAAAEDANEAIIELRRQQTSRSVAQPVRKDATELVARLRASAANAHGDDDGAWLARQLEAAVRAKSTVTVVVDLPGSGPVELTLEPTGIAGGRVRGRDRSADIERTLPLSHIVEVRTARTGS